MTRLAEVKVLLRNRCDIMCPLSSTWNARVPFSTYNKMGYQPVGMQCTRNHRWSYWGFMLRSTTIIIVYSRDLMVTLNRIIEGLLVQLCTAGLGIKQLRTLYLAAHASGRVCVGSRVVHRQLFVLQQKVNTQLLQSSYDDNSSRRRRLTIERGRISLRPKKWRTIRQRGYGTIMKIRYFFCHFWRAHLIVFKYRMLNLVFDKWVYNLCFLQLVTFFSSDAFFETAVSCPMNWKNFVVNYKECQSELVMKW